MKLHSLVVLSALLSACGPSPRQDGTEATSEPIIASTPAVPAAPTQATVVQNAPTAQEPNVVAQEPNTVVPQDPNADRDAFLNAAADPNILAGDGNPNHLNVDPGTGELDFRYGAFVAGGAPQSVVDECTRGVRAGAFSAPVPNLTDKTWTCDGTPCTFSLGVVSWSRSGYTETVYPDATGTLVLPSGTVCALRVFP